MAHFTHIDNGLVNLDFVTKILRITDADAGSGQFKLFDVRGEVLGVLKCSPDDIDLDLHRTEQLIPAQPGFNALHYCDSCETLSRMPIVAWQRSTDGRLAAVAIDGGIERGAIELPDGRVFDDGQSFSSRDEYVAWLREEGVQAAAEGMGPSHQDDDRVQVSVQDAAGSSTARDGS